VRVLSSEYVAGVALVAILSIVLFSFALVRYENSVDSGWQDRDKIFRIELVTQYSSVPNSGKSEQTFPVTDPRLKYALERSFDSERLQATRVANISDVRLLAPFLSGNQPTSLLVGDANFLDVFGVEIVLGDMSAWRNTPSTILISGALLDGTRDDLIGQRVSTSDGRVYTIGGIFRPRVGRSTLQFDAIVKAEGLPSGISAQSFSRKRAEETNASGRMDIIRNTNVTFVKLADTNKKQVAELLDTLPGALSENYVLRPLRDIYFHGESVFGATSGNYSLYISFFGLAVFSLFICLGNIVIFERVIANKHYFETTLNKVHGLRPYQVLVERSIRLAVRAIAVSLGAFVVVALYLVLTYGFDTFSQAMSNLFDPQDFLWTFAFVLISLIILGPWKRFSISNMKPLSLLKENSKRSTVSRTGSIWFVSAQFAIAVIVGLVATRFMEQAVSTRFMDRNLMLRGAVHLSLEEAEDESRDLLLQRLQQIAEAPEATVETGAVSSVAAASELLPGPLFGRRNVNAADLPTRQIDLPIVYVTPGFFELFDVPLRSGRFFTPTVQSDVYDSRTDIRDVLPVVVSQSAIEALWPENATGNIGDFVDLPLGIKGEIIGIAEDVIFGRDRYRQSSVIYVPDRGRATNAYVRTDLETPELINALTGYLPTDLMEKIQTRSLVDRLIDITRYDVLLASVLGILCAVILISAISSSVYLFMLLLDVERSKHALLRATGTTRRQLAGAIITAYLVPTAILMLTVLVFFHISIEPILFSRAGGVQITGLGISASWFAVLLGLAAISIFYALRSTRTVSIMEDLNARN
jgi:hypothetical protein